MKYNFENKGHLLECDYCNNNPQLFSKITEKMYCRYCDETYDKKHWYDPISIALSNFRYNYQDELNYIKYKKKLNQLDKIGYIKQIKVGVK